MSHSQTHQATAQKILIEFADAAEMCPGDLGKLEVLST
jgi:hypothetical protein